MPVSNTQHTTQEGWCCAPEWCALVKVFLSRAQMLGGDQAPLERSWSNPEISTVSIWERAGPYFSVVVTSGP